jgi:hypothetical protein
MLKFVQKFVDFVSRCPQNFKINSGPNFFPQRPNFLAGQAGKFLQELATLSFQPVTEKHIRGGKIQIVEAVTGSSCRRRLSVCRCSAFSEKSGNTPVGFGIGGRPGGARQATMLLKVHFSKCTNTNSSLCHNGGIGTHFLCLQAASATVLTLWQ